MYLIMFSMKYITEKDELKFHQLKIFGWKSQEEKNANWNNLPSNNMFFNMQK